MIAVLAGTSTLGVAAQAAVLAIFWRRTGLRYRPDFGWRGVGLSTVGKAAGWLFAMVVVSQLAGIVQLNVVTIAAGTGSSAIALSTAWLIFMVPYSVVAVSIMTVFFTRMSAHATTGNYDGVRADISTSMRTIGIVLVFAMMAMIVAAYPLSRIFVDSFTGVLDMGNLIIAFAIGTVPFSMVLVLQRTFYSLEDTRTVFFSVFAKSVLLVAGLLVVALLPVQHIGLAVALLTSAVSFVFFGMAFAVLRRRLGPIGGRLVSLRYLQYLAAGVVSGASGVAVMLLLGGYRADGYALDSWFTSLVTIGVVGTVMGAVYLATLTAMRNPELGVLAATIRSRVGRGRAE